MTDLEIPVGKRTLRYRFFEMLPAIVSYTFILAPLILSLVSPLAAAIFVIAYMISIFIC